MDLIFSYLNYNVFLLLDRMFKYSALSAVLKFSKLS